MYEVCCKLSITSSSGSSHLDFPNKWWSHSFLKVIYRSVWVQDLNYLLKLQKTILVCHKKGEDKKKKALVWHSYWYLIKVSVKHFIVEKLDLSPIELLHIWWWLWLISRGVSRSRRCRKSFELIKRNNKKTPSDILKKYIVEQKCGIQQNREAFTTGAVKMLKTIRNKELKFQFSKWWCGMLRNATFMKWKSNGFLQQIILHS